MQIPLTWKRAEDHGLRHASFPLPAALGVKFVDRELTIDHAVNVLTDYVATRDWRYSARWVPPRKLDKALRAVKSLKSSKKKEGCDTGMLEEQERMIRKHRKVYRELSPLMHHDRNLMLPCEYHECYEKLINKG